MVPPNALDSIGDIPYNCRSTPAVAWESRRLRPTVQSGVPEGALL